MIAFTDKDGNLTVAGTVREWSVFLKGLDRASLGRMNETLLGAKSNFAA
jgi:hypothetical protein